MGKNGKIRGLDNPERSEIGMVNPRSTSDQNRSQNSSLEVFKSIDKVQDHPERSPSRNELEMAGSELLISLIVPVFNEESNLGELIRRCLKTCDDMGKSYELILVDDGSKDSSSKIIKEAAEQKTGKVMGVLLNRNYGQHAAVMAGFAESRGDIIVTLDADLQNPPEEVPNLVKKIEEGFDVVGSIRIPRRDNLFRRAASLIINKIAQKATGVMMHDYGCMLRAYRRHIVNAMLQCDERSTFIPVLANSFARHTIEIEVQHEKRSEGQSKYSLWKLINLQFDLLTSMTTFPLRLLSVMGGIISSIGIGFGVFLIIMRFIYGSEWAAQGVFTLFAILFIFIGAQFIGMGLLGEYIGRVYYDVRGRPRYFVQQVVGRNSSEQKIENRKSLEVMI